MSLLYSDIYVCLYWGKGWGKYNGHSGTQHPGYRTGAVAVYTQTSLNIVAVLSVAKYTDILEYGGGIVSGQVYRPP